MTQRARSGWIVTTMVLVLAPVATYAQETAPPDLRSTPESSAPAPERSTTTSASYARRLASDLRALVTGPSRLDAAGWRDLGLGVAAVGLTSAFDATLRTDIQDRRSAGTDRFAREVRPLGQWGALALVGGAWIAGDAAGNSTLTSVGKDGIEASLLAAGLATPLIKEVAGRARPDAGQGAHSFHPFSGNASLPSGEATEAFAVAAVVSAHSSHLWVKGVAWGAAGLVGWERMNLDRHWASDIVAGALIGGGIGEWVVHRHRPTGSDHAVSWTVVPTGRGAEVIVAW